MALASGESCACPVERQVAQAELHQPDAHVHELPCDQLAIGRMSAGSVAGMAGIQASTSPRVFDVAPARFMPST